MQLHTDSYRFMTRAVKEAAQRHCGRAARDRARGRLFGGVRAVLRAAIVEALADVRTDVADPMLDLAIAQQPGARFVAFQRELLDELATSFGL